MKEKKTEIIFFVAGLALFAALLGRFGIDRVTENIAGAGWSLLGALFVWFAIYLITTISWKLLLHDSGGTMAFPKLFMINVAGFSLNTITPVVAIGGEAYKVNMLTASAGARRALSGVLVYRMVHIAGHMLMLLTGALAAVAFIPLEPPLRWTLILSSIVTSIIIILIFSGLRDGVFRRLQTLVARIVFLRKFNKFIKRHEESFDEMDVAVVRAVRSDRARFYGAVVLEYITRLLMGVELWIILRGTQMEISMVYALLIYVTYSIVINCVFFIPLNLGVREGGLVLGLQGLAIASGVGIYLAIILRIREFVWILIGLLLMVPLMRSKEAPHPERSKGDLSS